MENLKRIGIIVAARMSSNRLPGKALKPLMNIPMLGFLLRRLKGSVFTHEIILATSNHTDDDILVELAKKEGIRSYRGNLDDVTERYIGAAEVNKINTVVRVTGDCPFVNAELVDYCLDYIKNRSFDLATTKGLFPVGLDVEIYHNSTMSRLNQRDVFTAEHREHLTLYFYENQKNYNIVKIKPPKEWIQESLSYTVDTREDYDRMNTLVKNFNDEFFTISKLMSI